MSPYPTCVVSLLIASWDSVMARLMRNGWQNESAIRQARGGTLRNTGHFNIL